MNFSAANVPIARDTWAPKSPQSRPAPLPTSSIIYGRPTAAGMSGMTSSLNGQYIPPSALPTSHDAYRPRPQPPASSPKHGASGSSTVVPPPPAGSLEGSHKETRPPVEESRREGRAPAAPPARPANAPKAGANPVLGIFGLSIRTKERDLEDEFGRYGEVEKVVIVYDQRTDRSRGFGFVTMRKTEDASKCIDKLNGMSLHGRTIRVDFSATVKPHNPTPGEYMGAKRPLQDENPPVRRGSRGSMDRYEDRRGEDRDRRRIDDRDRRDDRRDYDSRDDRDRRRDDYGPPRRIEDSYSSRSRRDDYDRDRRRSPSPIRRPRSISPYRRPRAGSPIPRPTAQDSLRY